MRGKVKGNTVGDTLRSVRVSEGYWTPVAITS